MTKCQCFNLGIREGSNYDLFWISENVFFAKVTNYQSEKKKVTGGKIRG